MKPQFETGKSSSRRVSTSTVTTFSPDCCCGAMLASSVTARPLALSGTVSVVRPARDESATLTTSTLRAATLRANAATIGLASNATTFSA